jgi:hypothetical protein
VGDPLNSDYLGQLCGSWMPFRVGASIPLLRDPGRVKTTEGLLVQCIFGHVGPISRVDSNRALSNLHGKWFGSIPFCKTKLL